VTQLKAYDKAFGEFFARLAKDGITKDNTLFVVTADENDHFAGGPPAPTTCDGVNVTCSYAKKGEVDADLSLVYATEFGNTTPFRVHSDDAPVFYINGNPDGQTDAATRLLETEAAQMKGFDPIANNGAGGDNAVTQALADHAEEAFLHMISYDPNRTPNFILFGNPDYFLSASGHTFPLCAPTADAANCFVESPGFAWNHGDFQNQITRTWLGMVGPGIENLGEYGQIFSDHTDIRPTMLALAGLKDDYAHDGRVITEVLDTDAMPQPLREHGPLVSQLGQAYKQINAPRGELARKTLKLSTDALSGDANTYAFGEARINEITSKRNTIAGSMIDMLEGAEFDDTPIDESGARQLIDQANDLTAEVN
jgi:arylsulfatase A-like enzyme